MTVQSKIHGRKKKLLPELIHREQAVSTGASLQRKSPPPRGFLLQQEKPPSNPPHWDFTSVKVISQQRNGAAHCPVQYHLQGEKNFHSLFFKFYLCQGKGLWSILWVIRKGGSGLLWKGSNEQSKSVKSCKTSVRRSLGNYEGFVSKFLSVQCVERERISDGNISSAKHYAGI